MMKTRTLWGGRFKKGIHPLLKQFSYSLPVDRALLASEILVDIAWVKMLVKAGVLRQTEANRISHALKTIEKDLNVRITSQELEQCEDIHSLIQARLERKLGRLAKKMHTGRSRNDLVITSTRLYVKKSIDEIERVLTRFQFALVHASKKAGGLILSGMTHLRRAQPVLLAHHLLAYVEMLQEDAERLQDSRQRADVMALGSAALAGSSLPLDQKFLARQLGFSKIATNSMAAVSDRGFLTEYLSALSILWTHLSRLSEDFILWNSESFNCVELDDAFATGSSLMPQKKNPDVFELIRGRAGVIFGHLQALLTLQKGLPLTYNRDLQEDKPGVFDATHKTTIALELLALTVDSLAWNRQALAATVDDDYIFATDILEYLVRKRIPFSEAHATVGAIVSYGIQRRIPLRELSLSEWKQFSKAFAADIYDLFDALTSVTAKKTIGSTNPNRVQKEIAKWERVLKKRD